MTAKRSLRLPAIILMVVATTLSGCGVSPSNMPESGHRLASMDDMPDFVTSAPVTVQEAYRYAVANPDILTHIPCYCGCGPMGHSSNYSCYVAGQDDNGEMLFDAHAIGCSICVDITQDVMRLRAEGQQVEAIRSYVDGTYSLYGPSNMQ